jgi:hypothetical protein
MSEYARLTHIPKFYGLALVLEKQIHALNVSVDDIVGVKMEDAQAELPGE